jgi:NADH:ubiquinone oxidoreductase subunit 5 (subunit L)/multisubunit Na+/H+ antiporter MnhA subunit
MLLLVILVSSLMAVVYVWKVVEVAYFRSPAEPATGHAAGTREAPLGMLVVLWALIAANFWFGLDTRLPLATGRDGSRPAAARAAMSESALILLSLLCPCWGRWASR